MTGNTHGDLFSIEGKIALVTGGTSGIGRMMARGLVEGGAKTYFVARNAETCARTEEEFRAFGECRSIVADLSTRDGLGTVASAVSQAEDQLDILINNAGIHETQPIEVYSEELWDKTIAINAKSAFFLTQKLLPLLRKAGSSDDPARVINIASGHGIRVPPFDSYAYAVSKAGLLHLTRVLARRLAPDNINVNAIAPGVFPSSITVDFSDETVAAIVKGVPRGRYGDEKDIVGAMLYLSSRAGAYVTATILPVDGGWSGTA